MEHYREKPNLSLALKIYLGLIAFSLLGSLFSKLTGLDAGLMAPISSALTLLFGVIALAMPTLNRLGKNFGFSMIWVLLLGATVEIAGIYTGLPFGKYEYSDKWQPVVTLPGNHFFPVLLPLAWFLIVGGSFLMLRSRLSTVPSILLSALLATLIDVPMEHVMTKSLGYWQWLDPAWPIGPGLFGAPLMNAVGWFVTSLIAAIILNRGARLEEIESPEAHWVLGGHLVLTFGIGLIYEILRQPVFPLSR